MSDNETNNIPPIMGEGAAAHFLGVKPATLRGWRCTGSVNVPYVKIGRFVRYRGKDIEAFLDANTVWAGSAPGRGA